MKRKIVLSIVVLAVLAAAIATVVIINNRSGAHDSVESYNSIEEVNEAADFKIEYRDRLCGALPTDFEANSSTVEVRYGEAGYIRKTLGVVDNSGGDDYSEITDTVIDEREVQFKGDDGKVYIAVWNDNNFAYTISTVEGVEPDEMTVYVEATR